MEMVNNTYELGMMRTLYFGGQVRLLIHEYSQSVHLFTTFYEAIWIHIALAQDVFFKNYKIPRDARSSFKMHD